MDVNLRLRLTDEEAAALNHVLEKTPDGVFATAEVESLASLRCRWSCLA